MADIALIVGALLAACLGFLALALTTDRPWQRVVGSRSRPDRTRRRLMGAAIVFWAASLVLALLRDGPAFGAVLWPPLLSVAGFLVVAAVTWRPAFLTTATFFLVGLVRLYAGRGPKDHTDPTALDGVKSLRTEYDYTQIDQ